MSWEDIENECDVSMISKKKNNFISQNVKRVMMKEQNL
jgi:hypothetical protein